MKNLFVRILVPLFTIILLSSCSTMMFVDRTIPPEIELAREGQKIIIQNFFDYTKPEYVKEDHSEIYKAGGEAFSNSLVNYLGNSELIYAQIGDSIVKSEDGRILSDVLSPDYVEYTCEHFGADMLLAIDSLKLEFDFEVEGARIIFGGDGIVKHFYLNYMPYLSLYDRDGTLIERSYVNLSHHYSSRASITVLITIKPSLKNALDEAIILGQDAGIEYGSKFFSTIGSFPYKVYIGKPFKASFTMMQNNMWSDAIRYLLPLAESKDSKTAQRAAHNLWVAYIGFDDEASAELWYNKSLQY
jgi:hypothetical protein